MDWNSIILGLGGTLIGGGVSWMFFLKEKKASGKAEAINMAGDAMSKLLENINQQQESFNKMLKDKDASISERDQLIREYRKTLDSLHTEIQDLKLKVSENNRKVVGMQRVLNMEVSRRKDAEHKLCTVIECEERIPPLGQGLDNFKTKEYERID